MSSETFGKIRAFARRLRQQLDEGLDLREISRASYAAREAGEDVPYMQIADALPGRGGAATRLEAAPTATQRDLRKLFAEKAPGSALPRYILRVVEEDGKRRVVFTERLGKGKDVRDLTDEE